METTRELLTVMEVAQTYHVSDDTVRRWMRKGIIGYVMVGPFRVKRIPKVEAEKHFTPVPGADTGGTSV
jgi:excisionase family DNA binding protein